MVPFTIAKILLIMITSVPVLAAPTRFLDTPTLLENGRAAQKLNAAYRTFKATDVCIDSTKACVSGSVADCQNGAWVVGQATCSTSQVCFALPSNQKAGTVVTCTTEKNALSAIEATGATGGIFGISTVTVHSSSTNIVLASTACNSDPTNESNKDADTDCANPFAPSCTRMALTESPVSTSSRTRTKDLCQTTAVPSATLPVVVTRTITVGDKLTTLAPVTRTLSPENAFSIFAHLLSDGATIINGPSASVTSLSPTFSITPSVSIFLN